MDTCWRGIEYDLECHEADPRMICSWWAEDCYWSTWTCCHHGGGLRMGPQRVLKRNDEDLDPWVVAAMLFETVYVSMISVPRIKQQKNTQTVILDQLNGETAGFTQWFWGCWARTSRNEWEIGLWTWPLGGRLVTFQGGWNADCVQAPSARSKTSDGWLEHIGTTLW